MGSVEDERGAGGCRRRIDLRNPLDCHPREGRRLVCACRLWEMILCSLLHVIHILGSHVIVRGGNKHEYLVMYGLRFLQPHSVPSLPDPLQLTLQHFEKYVRRSFLHPDS